MKLHVCMYGCMDRMMGLNLLQLLSLCACRIVGMCVYGWHPSDDCCYGNTNARDNEKHRGAYHSNMDRGKFSAGHQQK